MGVLTDPTPLRLNRVDGVVEMPQVILPTEGEARTGGWTTIWLEFPIRILLETKQMNVAAWGVGAILNQGGLFF